MENVIMKDIIVKRLFSSESVGKRYSAYIIANVLNLDEEEVYKNIEYAPNYIGTNINVVDSEADLVLKQGKTIINLEFNNWLSDANKIKNETYIVQLYLSQLHTAKDYKHLKKIIQINIDNFDYLKANHFLYHSVMMETTLLIPDLRNIEIYHINLQYLREEEYNNLISDKSRLKELVYILICGDKARLSTLYERDEFMQKVSKELEWIAQDMKTWAYYRKEDLERKDREIDLYHHSQEIARNLLNTSLSFDEIAKCTGLTIEEVEEVQSEM